MAIETLKPPKTSFTYEWTCHYDPCSAQLRGEVSDCVSRETYPGQISFACPHCGRWTSVPDREREAV
jgi:hypothetical protein